MKKIESDNLKVLFLILFLFLVIGLIIFYYTTKDNVFSKYKHEKSKNIVYPIYQKGKTSVPHINLKGTGIDEINKIIVDKANNFLVDKNMISYNFEINGKILSLAIQYIDFTQEKDFYPIITYDVYNINFYTSQILNSNDMLEIYGLSEADVKPIVEARFVDFYNKEREENILNDECNYDCFLHQRGIENNNYMEDSYYYIKEADLYLVKPFKIYSVFNEEKFFSTKDFLIQITD